MLFWAVLLIGLALLQLAVLVGPPYVPTHRRQRQAALKLLGLKPGQTLYDLGCGDGSLLKDAAGQGLKAVGYEINPFLATVAWLRTRRFRKQVRIVVGNFWRADVSEADGIYVFLAGKYMKKLDDFMRWQNHKKTIRLVSYGFKIPSRKPAARAEGLFLYLYK